jgi:hypothetical protein
MLEQHKLETQCNTWVLWAFPANAVFETFTGNALVRKNGSLGLFPPVWSAFHRRKIFLRLLQPVGRNTKTPLGHD